MEPEKQTHLSAFIIGFLLCLCLFLALGSSRSSENAGRYQCCAAGSDSLSVFVLDTYTGHTWRLSRNDSTDLGTPYERISVRYSVNPIVK